MWVKWLRELGFFLIAFLLSLPLAARETQVLDEIARRDLPVQAQRTLALIERGGPYPYAKDGAIFGNRERRLPRQPRGYYREYTVPTPGVPHRGARRIVAGGTPPAAREFYYTDDHYASFRYIVH